MSENGKIDFPREALDVATVFCRCKDFDLPNFSRHEGCGSPVVHLIEWGRSLAERAWDSGYNAGSGHGLVIRSQFDPVPKNPYGLEQTGTECNVQSGGSEEGGK